jgi:hypothetical protein
MLQGNFKTANIIEFLKHNLFSYNLSTDFDQNCLYLILVNLLTGS